MENKLNMKFIWTNNTETAHKLRYEQYTELTDPDDVTHIFLNDGKKLNFDAEKNGCVYSNKLFV